jgi:hypothetical protein
MSDGDVDGFRKQAEDCHQIIREACVAVSGRSSRMSVSGPDCVGRKVISALTRKADKVRHQRQSHTIITTMKMAAKIPTQPLASKSKPGPLNRS